MYVHQWRAVLLVILHINIIVVVTSAQKIPKTSYNYITQRECYPHEQYYACRSMFIYYVLSAVVGFYFGDYVRDDRGILCREFQKVQINQRHQFCHSLIHQK